MKTTTILGLGLVGFLVLALFTIIFTGNWIEDDLASRSGDELKAVGQNWADVKMSGRDAMIVGAAPDDGSMKSAVDAVANVWGVRVVRDDAGSS